MRFVLPAEVRSARLALDLGATMHVNDYSLLVAECAFPKIHYVECQLIDNKGHACRQMFGKGWVARRKDGVEVFIGGTCALRHFLGAGAESLNVFKAHSAELVRQNKLRDANARLQAFLSDQEYARRLATAAERARGLRARVHLERGCLPHAVLERLRHFGGGRLSVPGEEKHFEKIERDGKVIEVPDWRSFSFGVIAHPEAIMPSIYLPIEKKIRAAEEALTFGSSFIANDLRSLTTSLNALAAGDACGAELDVAMAAVNAFASPANLRVVCWLALTDADRRKVVSRALELEGRPAKPHDAKNELIYMQKAIRARNGDREFRPIQ